MRNDRIDEIINNILQLRLDITKIDLKLEQTFREIGEIKSKKEIPKKIIKQQEEPTDKEIEELADLGFCGGEVMRCPSCHEYIVINNMKYCMECGQRLDWS